jgi:enterochelin esterase-like enzyme
LIKKFILKQQGGIILITSHVRDDNTAVFHYPDPYPGSVFVTGSFCGWDIPGYELRRTGSTWAVEIPNFPQGEHEYKFIVDGHWVPDPVNVNMHKGSENSIITHRMNRGSIFHFEFYSPAINENRGYVIYLPPGYYLTDEKYPTVYLLHGALDWEYTWVHKGLVHMTLDHLRASGKIGEMIVVMPRENGELFRGDDRYADYIAKDLVGHVDYEFRTISHQRQRAIDGLSTGAFSSMVLGAWKPHVFSSIGTMSGCYDRRAFEAVWHNGEAMRRNNQKYHVSCGFDEPCIDTCRELARTLVYEGIPVEYYENPGPHDWELWRPAVSGNMQFHWWNFQR